jgi:acyl carrier protein
MTTTTVTERVKKIVAEKLNVTEDKISDKSHFINDLGADSLDTLSWSWPLKKNLAVKFPMKPPKKLPPLAMWLVTSKPTASPD